TKGGVMATIESPASPARASGLFSPTQQARVATLQVVVKKETPFLPKVAFTLITLASMAGAVFTALGLGVTGRPLAARRLALSSLALAGGFLVWRVVYRRDREPDVHPQPARALKTDSLARAPRVQQVVAGLVALGFAGPL